MKYYFCGIGGVGMRSIAEFLKFKGNEVFGSDRAFDLKDNEQTKKRLSEKGIILFPQDGSGVNKDIDCLVVSTAVEDTIPDVQRALSLNIPIKKRAEILAEILHSHKGIAIGGTSGKTTITAMSGHILYENAFDPVVINGGTFVNEYNGCVNSNVILGNGDYCVIESDESDGTIELYHPEIAVVSNVSLDHKPIEDLMKLFSDFVKRANTGAVINLDCPYAKTLSHLHPNTITFSCDKNKNATLTASDIQKTQEGVSFLINGVKVLMSLQGLHNVQNAMAAIGACMLAGVSLENAAKALSSFKGTKRRLEKIGCFQDIIVYDDYAHNPEKIAATLRTLKSEKGRLFAVFQPHGFAPLRLMKDELITAFLNNTDSSDFLIFPEVFYQGGTVVKDISSKNIADALTEQGRRAFFFEKRQEIPAFIAENIKSSDTVVVMGARDNTLTNLAKEILQKVKEKQ